VPSSSQAVEAVEAVEAEHNHTPSPSAEGAPSFASTKNKGEKAARHPNERPVPAFEGTTIAGTKISMSDLLGSRVVLFFVDPSVKDSAPVAQGVNRLAAISGDHNFRIIGIGIGSDASELGRFAKEQGLTFPVINDSRGEVKGQLRLQAPIAVLGVDADGYMTFGMGRFPHEGNVADWTEQELRKHLRIGDAAADDSGALDTNPQAPELGVKALSNGAVLQTAEFNGQAAIVIFFLHTCPHCHKALESIKGILASMPEGEQPRLVAISIQNAPSAIRKSLAELGLDFFDPYLDPDGSAAKAWGVTGGVPVVTVVDKAGKIRHRSEGWNGQRDGAMLRMQVARAAETRVPMLLEPKGYSGNDVCGVCHEQEYATWQYTKHATAFDTLVKHTADRRKDCVGCHVVGFEEPGGYAFTRRAPHLENVGCESCHGRGGPHLSPGFVKKNTDPDAHASAGYEAVCATCHNPTHSLGFEFKRFHEQVSHARIAGLSNTERAGLLEGGGPKRNLLPTQADYVGSAACQSCHTKEFETWEASPHGHAVATLQAAGKAGEAECLQCHTTAFGEPGGFSPAVAIPEQTDLARVGCESCHGAGGDHIGENAKRVGTILSLGDKCDSCVILKVCGTCHDDANDPGFQFEVEERIEAQRHGTIESAATKAGESAFHSAPHSPHAGPHAFDQGPKSSRSPSNLGAAESGEKQDRELLQAAFDRLAQTGRPLSSRVASDQQRDPS
jgi:peroxiredoxin